MAGSGSWEATGAMTPPRGCLTTSADILGRDNGRGGGGQGSTGIQWAEEARQAAQLGILQCTGRPPRRSWDQPQTPAMLLLRTAAAGPGGCVWSRPESARWICRVST